ncbi:GNAT family N-acetyltransferase [Streptomyces sp. NL15-2K]|uniref:GNAT family N-acetyltransferase n=1 Tax=Streptomyces sp. NL15-2K TaxID=376149 RepID=UPI000F57FBD2|nr:MULTISPECIES: GNAT family N-acetyltransferase [Actinomycetes]WKX06464.1 GNAT family N-acetyltransferase [Kutzneria buriramensis]
MGPDEPTSAQLWSTGTPTEIVMLDPDGRVVGRLRFRACRTCRAGRILDIWVCEAWRHQGLGRELVHSLLAHRPGYLWTTTSQTPDGRAFFLTMARETAVVFPHGGALCRHLMGPFRRSWRYLLAHWSPRRPRAH